MADDLIARQAQTYRVREARPATHLERAGPPPPSTPLPKSQQERQAETYRQQPEAPISPADWAQRFIARSLGDNEPSILGGIR